MLDSAAGQAIEALNDTGVNLTALNSEIQSVRMAALAVVWGITDAIIEKDLGEGELPSDRLDVLLAVCLQIKTAMKLMLIKHQWIF
jgi:hypothetical protein